MQLNEDNGIRDYVYDNCTKDTCNRWLL